MRRRCATLAPKTRTPWRGNNMAGDGLPLHGWTQQATEEQDPWALGRARQLRRFDEGETMIVADFGQGAVALLNGWPLGAEPIDPESAPPIWRPLVELDNLAPSTWYINIVATERALRGKGLGRRLMLLAEDLARASGLDRTSLVVSDANAAALGLSHRLGYQQRASRPVVTDGFPARGRDWLQLCKDIA